MRIYLEPRMVTAKHAEQLRERFPEIHFTQDGEDRKDVDALFCHPAFAVKPNLDRYPNLSWVQLLMAGYDASDLKEMARRGIVVTNLRDVFQISIAEDVFTKILVLNRAVRHDLAMMEEGRWEAVRHLPEIYGSTVGILGTGSLGQAIATRMQAFGATVLGYRRKSAPAGGFDEILVGTEGLHVLCSRSDYVIACLPSNHGTLRLIDAEAFAAMKPDALFVNVGRGDTVDQDALVAALRERRIRGAALDVMTPEPLPPDHPLWRMDNVFITPHNASSSPFVWPRIIRILHENIARRIDGVTLLNLIGDGLE